MKGKVLAVVLAASMLLSMAGVGASAAPKDTANTVAVTQKVSRKVYEIRMNDKEISLVKNGKVIASYESKDGKVTLKKGKTGKVVMMFRDAKTGKQRNIILGDLDAVLFTGKTKSLIISKGFPKDTEIVVDKKAKLDELKVSAEVDVTVKGEVKKIIITTAKADVTVEKGAKVSKVITVSKSAISGVASDKITVEAVKPVSSSSSSSSSDSSDRGTSSSGGSGSGSSETPSTPEEPEENPEEVKVERAFVIDSQERYKELPATFRAWDSGKNDPDFEGWENLAAHPWIAIVFSGPEGTKVSASDLTVKVAGQIVKPWGNKKTTIQKDGGVFTAFIGTDPLDLGGDELGAKDDDAIEISYKGNVIYERDSSSVTPPVEESVLESISVSFVTSADENEALPDDIKANPTHGTDEFFAENPWIVIELKWKNGKTDEIDLSKLTITKDGTPITNPWTGIVTAKSGDEYDNNRILTAYLGSQPEEDKNNPADALKQNNKAGTYVVSYDGEVEAQATYSEQVTASYSEKEDSEPVAAPTLATEAGKPESTKPTDEPKVDDVTDTAPTVEGTTEGTTGPTVEGTTEGTTGPTVEGTTEGTTGSTVEGTTEGTAGSTVEGTTESTETVPSEDLTPAAPATEE